MPKPTDDRLIAYLDGELDESERAAITDWLERDGELRERAAALTEGAATLRAAFDEVLREPLPERLIAAARQAPDNPDNVVELSTARRQGWRRVLGDRRWWMGAAAASLAAFAVGWGLGGGEVVLPGSPEKAAMAPGAEFVSDSFPDNLAGYYRRYGNPNPSEPTSFDKLPQNFHLPNLKPWGLDFQGARFLMAEGQPAMALVYTTSNKALGPVIVVVANSAKPDDTVRFARSGDINVLRWRHHGHAYALAGTASANYLWNIHNDLAYQFDGI
jgi:anti-sigma factor RsiW